MDQSELIRETNDLIKRVLELDAKRKEEAEASQATWEEKKADVERLRKDALSKKLDDLGVDRPSGLNLEEIDWDQRRKENMAKSEERIAKSKQEFQEYRKAVLDEMRIQSDLLRRIAEKLEA